MKELVKKFIEGFGNNILMGMFIGCVVALLLGYFVAPATYQSAKKETQYIARAAKRDTLIMQKDTVIKALSYENKRVSNSLFWSMARTVKLEWTIDSLTDHSIEVSRPRKANAKDFNDMNRWVEEYNRRQK